MKPTGDRQGVCEVGQAQITPPVAVGMHFEFSAQQIAGEVGVA
jgi:hypothetical protein